MLVRIEVRSASIQSGQKMVSTAKTPQKRGIVGSKQLGGGAGSPVSLARAFVSQLRVSMIVTGAARRYRRDPTTLFNAALKVPEFELRKR